MIQSFANKATVDLFLRTQHAPCATGSAGLVAHRPTQAPGTGRVAARLDDLQIPAGNRLERLKGTRSGQHSIRINEQYRVTFRWENGHAYEVGIEDYQ